MGHSSQSWDSFPGEYSSLPNAELRNAYKRKNKTVDENFFRSMFIDHKKMLDYQYIILSIMKLST